MADLTHTHALSYEGDRVVKRHLATEPGAGDREWRALTLLAAHAPGLAPEPIAYEDGAVTMSRLDGVPLRSLPPGDVPVAALTGALARLHAAVPAHVLEGVPVRPYQREDVVEWVGRRGAQWRSRGARADLAVKEGLRWLEGWEPVAAAVELSPQEERRMRECRRLHALMWLFLLSHESPRNPPGTFGRQVERVLSRL